MSGLRLTPLSTGGPHDLLQRHAEFQPALLGGFERVAHLLEALAQLGDACAAQARTGELCLDHAFFLGPLGHFLLELLGLISQRLGLFRFQLPCL